MTMSKPIIWETLLLASALSGAAVAQSTQDQDASAGQPAEGDAGSDAAGGDAVDVAIVAMPIDRSTTLTSEAMGFLSFKIDPSL